MRIPFRLCGVMAVSFVCLAGVARQCPGPWDSIKVEGNLKGGAQNSANYRVMVVIKDLETGRTDEHDGSSTVKQMDGGYSYYIHFDPEKVDPKGALEITTTVIDAKTGEVVAIKKEIRTHKYDWQQWQKCQTIHLNPVYVPKDSTALPVGTATGVVLTGKDQKPIVGASVKFYSSMSSVSNPAGHFVITGIPSGRKGDIIAPYPEYARVRNQDDFFPTWVNVAMPVDRGVNVGPIRVLTVGQWDSLRAWAKDSLGIVQSDLKGFVFGQVKNYYGFPIPDAVVSLVPASGKVVYFDPVEWDTASYTKVRDGFFLGASYMIFNAERLYQYVGRLVAIHRVTGDTIGVFNDVSVPGSNWIVTQADIVARDSIPPGPIADLKAEKAAGWTLTWTAPGDDGNQGKAYRYDIRYSTEPVGADTLDWWWNAAAAVDSPPAPQPAGVEEIFAPGGLSPDSLYHIMIMTFDEAANRSGYSNAAHGIDETAAGPISWPVLDIGSNPAFGRIAIRFAVSHSCPVRLAVYAVSGRRIATLVDGAAASGRAMVFWNGTDDRARQVGAGVYLCRLEVAGRALTKKIVLLR